MVRVCCSLGDQEGRKFSVTADTVGQCVLRVQELLVSAQGRRGACTAADVHVYEGHGAAGARLSINTLLTDHGAAGLQLTVVHPCPCKQCFEIPSACLRASSASGELCLLCKRQTCRGAHQRRSRGEFATVCRAVAAASSAKESELEIAKLQGRTARLEGLRRNRGGGASVGAGAGAGAAALAWRQRRRRRRPEWSLRRLFCAARAWTWSPDSDWLLGGPP